MAGGASRRRRNAPRGRHTNRRKLSSSAEWEPRIGYPRRLRQPAPSEGGTRFDVKYTYEAIADAHCAQGCLSSGPEPVAVHADKESLTKVSFKFKLFTQPSSLQTR